MLVSNMDNILSTTMGNTFCVVFTVLLLSFSLLSKFCGSTIAGLSLLSDSIMRLVKEDATGEWMDLLLPRLSLYILRFSICCTHFVMECTVVVLFTAG